MLHLTRKLQHGVALPLEDMGQGYTNYAEHRGWMMNGVKGGCNTNVASCIGIGGSYNYGLGAIKMTLNLMCGGSR